MISYAPFLWRKEQHYTEEMAGAAEANRITQETTTRAAAKRKLQKSRDRRQANCIRTRAQIQGKTDSPTKEKHQSPMPKERKENSEPVQPYFSKIHRASMTGHPLPINYCELSDEQVLEIQLANYRALRSKQHTRSSESFCPLAPPMNEGTETSSQSQINGSSEQQVVTATH